MSMRSMGWMAGWVGLTAMATAAWGQTCGGLPSAVNVVLDLNPRIPGCQNSLLIEPGTGLVQGLAVYLFDPTGQAKLISVGYVGGINRGIALGHVPTNGLQGRVVDVRGFPGTAIHPNGAVWAEPGFDPLFAGPEVQFGEWGGESPAPIPAMPGRPVITAEVELSDAKVGDEYLMFLGDKVSLWLPNSAAFSTTGFLSLDTGGDFVPDGTQTLEGVDADRPLPVPPASYYVDYVDGAGGARIRVVRFGDGDSDGDFDLFDYAGFENCFTGDGGDPVQPPCAAFDADQDGDVALDDYKALFSRWSGPK